MSVNKFREIAKKETSFSELMVDRMKITTDEVISNFPDGITLQELDIVTIDGKSFPVFTFKEDVNACLFGGVVLNNIATEWIRAYDGDIDKTSSELKACGGVKVKLKKGRTKKGQNITTVEVI